MTDYFEFESVAPVLLGRFDDKRVLDVAKSHPDDGRLTSQHVMDAMIATCTIDDFFTEEHHGYARVYRSGLRGNLDAGMFHIDSPFPFILAVAGAGTEAVSGTVKLPFEVSGDIELGSNYGDEFESIWNWRRTARAVKRSDSASVMTLESGGIYRMDPTTLHRRPRHSLLNVVVRRPRVVFNEITISFERAQERARLARSAEESA